MQRISYSQFWLVALAALDVARSQLALGVLADLNKSRVSAIYRDGKATPAQFVKLCAIAAPLLGVSTDDLLHLHDPAVHVHHPSLRLFLDACPVTDGELAAQSRSLLSERSGSIIENADIHSLWLTESVLEAEALDQYAHRRVTLVLGQNAAKRARHRAQLRGGETADEFNCLVEQYIDRVEMRDQPVVLADIDSDETFARLQGACVTERDALLSAGAHVFHIRAGQSDHAFWTLSQLHELASAGCSDAPLDRDAMVADLEALLLPGHWR